MGYAELLKDPRWQRKRLEIMERDGWSCQSCGDTEATLTIHHKSYRMTAGKFADIWDYPGEDLTTLCEECHSEEEANLDRLKKTIYFDIRTLCQDSAAMDDAVDFLTKLYSLSGERLTGRGISGVLEIDRESLASQLESFAKEVASDPGAIGERIANSLVDCCNFILIEGLNDGGHHED